MSVCWGLAKGEEERRVCVVVAVGVVPVVGCVGARRSEPSVTTR